MGSESNFIVLLRASSVRAPPLAGHPEPLDARPARRCCRALRAPLDAGPEPGRLRRGIGPGADNAAGAHAETAAENDCWCRTGWRYRQSPHPFPFALGVRVRVLTHPFISSRHRAGRGGRGNGERGKGRGEHLRASPVRRGGPVGTPMGADEPETAGSLSGVGVGE